MSKVKHSKFSKILAGVLIVTSCFTPLSAVAEGAEEFVFSDVPDGKWYSTYVDKLNRAGLISGYEDGTFRPNGTITVAEYMALCVYSTEKKAQLPEKKEGEHWAMPLYDRALSMGLATSSDGFDRMLDQPIKREDMAYMLVNVASYKGETFRSLPNIQYKMSDYEQIAENRREVLKKAYSSGIMTGSGGKFNPKSPATRAEACTVLVKLLSKEERTVVTVSEIQFENKSMTPAQVRKEADKMIARIGVHIQELDAIAFNWACIANTEMHYLIHAAPHENGLQVQIENAKQNTDPKELEDELKALQVQMDFKEKLMESCEVAVSRLSGNHVSFPKRLDAEKTKKKDFVKYSDTYALQLLDKEVSEMLEIAKKHDQPIQVLLKEAEARWN